MRMLMHMFQRVLAKVENANECMPLVIDACLVVQLR